MIDSFNCKKTQRLFETGECDKAFHPFQRQAERALCRLEAAVELYDLRIPPGNHFEALGGDKKGQFSIRINDSWRICFTWEYGKAKNVAITDYH
ncbi:type II toxin-antitoxin system RelE/ParE family toxin [Desulfolutivibrio sulfoxidireducens]|uniref:type II toxin-antitoxin system RelE/ParE family toxin n=1 Tax=Desulfolutivibrio sulfoxidireducens TaxID=2773299 RepID=UPI00159DA1E1|nr:type II toxin-antitoxin system RelE/ParE family toxin [Desulfolutivibrio sulfoxidireducens]QLA18774.1 type II toxin-antitoxin system RelE/ParE family toxin [Desulfolutivibrio sulfoxidireducens]